MSKSPLSRLFSGAAKTAEKAVDAVDILTGQDPVARLEARLADAIAAAEQAAKGYTDANLAAELSDGDENSVRELDTARAALAKARERVEGLTAAVQAAKERAASTGAAQAAAERAKRWDAAEALAKQREGIGADIEKLAAELAAKFGQLHDKTVAIQLALPHRADASEKISCRLEGTEGAARMALVKAGLRWAGDWPWTLEELPPLTKLLADASAQLTQLRKTHG